MRRDPRSFLWDVCDATDAILTFTRGRGLEQYRSDRMLRSAVERQFEIIGEALSRLAKADPDTAGRIPGLRRIVGFRNALIHGYDRIDDAVVWRIVESDLPELRAQVEVLRAELGPTP
jgi:uncharacterized protein with HEPN domain